MSQSFNTAALSSSSGYKTSIKELLIGGGITVAAIWGYTSVVRKGPQPPADNKDAKSGNSEKSKDNNASSVSDGTGSGGDPPKPSQNLDRGENNESSLSFQEFINLLTSIIEELKLTHHLHVNELNNILVIFNGLSKEDKKSLMKVMKRLYKNRCLKQIIKIVATLLSARFPEHINYLDFLRFTEFVGVYVLEEAQRQILANNGNEAFNTRLDDILNGIGNSTQTVEDVANEYLRIREDIDSDVDNNGRLSPDFRNEPAAIYHYLKHRRVPGEVDEFDVMAYYSLIRCLLNDLKRLKEYGSVVNSGGQLVYEVHIARYGRRFKLVVKVHGSDIILSSAYFVDDPVPEDKDGDVFINGAKL